MRTTIVLLAIAAGVCHGAEERNTTQRTFAVVPANAKLIIDTMEGNITVSGYSGQDVQVSVNERWRGDNSDKLQEGRRNIRLDMTQEASTVKLYVDGPFRCGRGCTNWDGERGYSARFDFDVKVPLQTILDLRTVNGGRIEIENVDGDYSVRNVNGSINMKGIGGAGGAHTVNGQVSVAYKRNPKEPCSFKTVNGEINATFQPGLGADLRLKTLNGDAWTDFDPSPLPAIAEPGERRGTRYVYKRDRTTRMRVGSGGPEHSFETLNGSIRILSKGQ